MVHSGQAVKSPTRHLDSLPALARWRVNDDHDDDDDEDVDDDEDDGDDDDDSCQHDDDLSHLMTVDNINLSWGQQ